MSIISENAIQRRQYWVQEIHNLSGDFSGDSDRLESEIQDEIQKEGIDALVGHLRLCGNIPESYGHDTSEEKLYSKYTDILLSEAFKAIGLKSLVLKGRGDAADVEVFAEAYSFVADAKSFRLSRTAKNQKDFKVQAMDSWKRNKPYAMIVCPIYHLPVKASQIYQQATTHNVCIFSYSHLALLVNLARIENPKNAEHLLQHIFNTVKALNPLRDAVAYWLALNRAMLEFSQHMDALWQQEKQATGESISVAKEEALRSLSDERERIIRMSHAEALGELLRVHKIENRVRVVESMSNSGLFEIK